MAPRPSAKQLSSLFLLLFLSLSLFFTNVTAGRYFFSKMTRTEPTEAVSESGVSEENKNSTTFPSISQGSGYGLYGRGPEQFSPTTANSFNNAETVGNEKNFNGNVHGGFKNRFDNTNDDPYKFSSEFIEGQNGPNYDQRNRQYRYGMSDTRFLENGRYYYDINARRYGYGSDTNPARTNPNEYRSYGPYVGDGTVGRYGNEGYGTENGNEYHKVLNENENKGEEDRWGQEEDIP